MNTVQVYETKQVDHLGIVAGICHGIGLIETIDQAVGSRQRKVNCGAAVQAMVLNVLGFSSRALYLWTTSPNEGGTRRRGKTKETEPPRDAGW